MKNNDREHLKRSYTALCHVQYTFPEALDFLSPSTHAIIIVISFYATVLAVRW